MKEYIEKQQAIDTLCKSECGCNNAECGHRDNTDFCVTCDNVKIIKSLPSAQPILTCDGCRYDGYYKHMRCRNCIRKERDLYEPE